MSNAKLYKKGYWTPGQRRSVQRMVRVRVSVTPKEAEALLSLLRCAANEPSDVDAAEFQSLQTKFERALSGPNSV